MPPRPRIARLLAWLPALLLLTLTAGPTLCGEGSLAALKVAYIYNFTGLVRWPPATAGDPFVIAVIGDHEMAASLRALEHEHRQVGGRPIAIRTFDTPAAITPSEILFVGAEMEDRLPEILRRTAGRPTLLLADALGFARAGVAIELFPKRDILRKKDLLRFRINPKALAGRGLTVPSQLYDVGEIVP